MNPSVLPEGILALVLQNICVWVVPFLAYFLGIVVRKKALPGKDSPPLKRQLWLGIPLSLIVASPLIMILRNAFIDDFAAYLLTTGIIIEHGMLVNEVATKRIEEHIKQLHI